MESRQHVRLPDASDQRFINEVLEHFYASLSDFERANECLVGAGYVAPAPIFERFDVTYPLALVLGQDDYPLDQHQQRPLNVRINLETHPQRTLPMYVRGFRFPTTIIEYVENNDSTQTLDEKADSKNRIVPEAVRELVDYYESLSPELKYYLTVVEWGCSGDLEVKLEHIRRQLPAFLEIEERLDDCDKRTERIKSSKDIPQSEKQILLKKVREDRNMLSAQSLALQPKLLDLKKQATAQIQRRFAESLDIRRIDQCIRTMHDTRPEFLRYVRALTRLEICETQGNPQREADKLRYIKDIKAKATGFGQVKVVDMTDNQKEEYFRELHIECDAAYNMLTGKENANAQHATAGALRTLEQLAKFTRDDLLSVTHLANDGNNNNSPIPQLIADLNHDVGTIRNYFNLPLAPKVERVLDPSDGMYIEDEVPVDTNTVTKSVATPKHFLRFILDNLPESARKLVVSEQLLENLKALANESLYWEKQPNGHITQQNLWLLINALIKARAKLICQSGNPVNARDVSYEDADQVLQYCESLVREEIAASEEQGIKMAKLVNRLEDYRNKVAAVKASALSHEEKTEKLLKLADKIAHIPLEVSSKTSLESSEVAVNEMMNQLMDKMIKLLASDITKSDRDYVNAIIDTVNVNPQIVVISDMLNAVCFVKACLDVLDNTDLDDKQRKQELVRLLKHQYEFKREMVFNMSGCDLSGCKMLNITRNHLLLNKANLQDILMQGCVLPGVNCIAADMKRVKIIDSDLTGCVLAGSDLSGAKFSQVKLLNANLDNCVLRDLQSTSDVSFKTVSLKGAEFIHLDKKYSVEEWARIFADWERWEVPSEARQYNLMMNMNATGRYKPSECQQIAELFTRPVTRTPTPLSSPLVATLFNDKHDASKKSDRQPPKPN